MKLTRENFVKELKLIFNKELYEKKIITFDVFKKMEELIIKKG